VDNHFEVLTQAWKDFDKFPGYQGRGVGTKFPIFLPFWDKRIEDEPWLSLWQDAYTRLRQVSTLVVWGYSLPATDFKAQQLFALALRGNQFCHLCVIDPSRSTRERWREMIPDALYWEYEKVQDFFDFPPTWWRAGGVPSEPFSVGLGSNMPLKREGSRAPENMQWQTVADAKAKDRME
jgi:hypothetical protein